MTWSLSPRLNAASNPNSMLCMPCENIGLTVNQAESKAVVVDGRTHEPNLVFAGQAVEHVAQYKYLGVVMHQNGSFMCAVESLQNAAQRA